MKEELNNIIHTIAENTGIVTDDITPVYGGDINQSFCIRSQKKKYFLKVNDAHRYPLMFEKEAEGLNALRTHSSFVIPSVIHHAVVTAKQYLLLEWIEKGNPSVNFWEEFGKILAMMHRQPQPFFGWTSDNYIGSIIQLNYQYQSWSSFYAECRILPLVKQGFDNGLFDKKDVQSSELLCNKLDDLFPEEPPSLLHGDLWNGNFMVSSIGKSTIFDPAVYYGHREMDIGMSRLFGGFAAGFYEAYNEYYPLETQWQQRFQLTQLYPLLVHSILFGSNYIHQCKSILRQFSQ